MDGEHVVMVADIAACMGINTALRNKEGTILLKSEGESQMGFVVYGEIRSLSISTTLIVPFPDFLKSPLFDSCAIHGDRSIPVIKLTSLYFKAVRAGEEAPENLYRIRDAKDLEVSSIKKFRTFFVGGESFALPADGVEDVPINSGPITTLPNTPPYVKGVSYLKERPLPVIDLSQRINNQNAAEDAPMLINRIEETDFGLIIDRDGELLSDNEVTIKALPLIAQTSWMKLVLERQGLLTPLIDVAMALSVGSSDEIPIWQRYVPESNFHDMFLRQEVDVVELSLPGARHALPKSEVEDVIPFSQSRVIPNVPPIVLGVLEHNEEVLPVLDLAMMFGRRSIVTPLWKMMLVKNGDFRALVITDSVFEDRHLSPEVQRKVPIQLPHDLMYGCYPVDNSVRIILNIKSIAVHFNRSIVQILMPALSQEMRLSPTGEVFEFRNEQEVNEDQQPVAREANDAEIQVVLEPDSESIQEREANTTAPATDMVQDDSGEWHEWDSDEDLEVIGAEKIDQDILPSEEIIMPVMSSEDIKLSDDTPPQNTDFIQPSPGDDEIHQHEVESKDETAELLHEAVQEKSGRETWAKDFDEDDLPSVAGQEHEKVVSGDLLLSEVDNKSYDAEGYSYDVEVE